MAVKKKDVQDIVEAIGGRENLDTATHCVTRLRLVLKDDDKEIGRASCRERV